MKSYNTRLIILLLITFFACKKKESEFKLHLEERPIYNAKKASNTINIDGKMLEKDWLKAEERSFNYYYGTEKPSDKQKTTFRMLWDDETLYLYFESEDQFLTAKETKRDGAPFLDDCAELFIIPHTNSARMHFCFEVNLYEAKNDIVFVNNFSEDKNIVAKAYNPEYKVKAIINGTLNNNTDIDKGWSMEFAIPIAAFRGAESYNLKNGTKWTFLALSQDRNDTIQGRRVFSTLFPVENKGPQSVHNPNSFGLVEFVD